MQKRPPKICILKTDGINCEEETAYACRRAGGDPHIVHINALRTSAVSLLDYDLLIIPGGFSYGDDVKSGRILANELMVCLVDQLLRFVESGRGIIGICNGFQVLVRAGLLPGFVFGQMELTLAINSGAHFEHRDVWLVCEESPCVYTKGTPPLIIVPVAHGEGRIAATKMVLNQVEAEKLVVYRYARADGKWAKSSEYPANPNGSIHGIAALCNPAGNILGIMPHPERHVDQVQQSNWRRANIERPHGLLIFENAIQFASRF
jgi:phosphoribosylformylglycinamidine synthase I